MSRARVRRDEDVCHFNRRGVGETAATQLHKFLLRGSTVALLPSLRTPGSLSALIEVGFVLLPFLILRDIPCFWSPAVLLCCVLMKIPATEAQVCGLRPSAATPPAAQHPLIKPRSPTIPLCPRRKGFYVE